MLTPANFWILLLITLISHINGNKAETVADFTGCQVLAVIPSTEDDLSFLKNLYHQDMPGVEFWSTSYSLMSNATIQICPEGRQNTTAMLDNRGIHYAVQIENLQSIIVEEKLIYELFGRRFYKTSGLESFAFDQYHTATEIENFLEVAAKKFPNIMSLINIGTTANGRMLKVVKLSTKSSNDKPIIWIDSGIHAREWVTISSSLYIINQMLTSNNPSTKSLLQMYDWYWMPLVNPDGYEYSWNYNRLWRKNRSKCQNTRSSCCGVDLNRNFDAHFEGSHSSSTYRCSQLYKGESAFSERETEILKNYVSTLRKNLKAFVTIHSYSQVWLLPYGYQYPKPKDYKDMLEVAQLAAKSLENVHGTKFRCGTIAEIMYVTSGSSVDWAYDTLNVKYSYALELRDTGKHGFLLPNSQIIPTGEEVFQSLSTMAKEIAKRELQKA